jgi:hypothetical protein
MSFVFKYFLAFSSSLTCNCFVFRCFLASFQMGLCVFNNILASVVSFFIYFQLPLSPSAPPSRHSLRRVSKRLSPTTMCPQNNHDCRLSQVSGFVKQKMREKAKREASQRRGGHKVRPCELTVKLDLTVTTASPGGSRGTRAWRSREWDAA